VWCVVTSQRGETKLNQTKFWILSTTLSIALILGGVICVVILRKYQMKSHVLHEIQQGMSEFKFIIIFCLNDLCLFNKNIVLIKSQFDYLYYTCDMK